MQELSLLGTLAAVAVLVVLLQRRAAALAAREKEGKAILDAFFASSPLAIALFDRDLRFVRVNDTYASRLRLTPEEHVGRTLTELEPGLAEQVEPMLEEIFETGLPVVGRETTLRGRTYRASHYPIRGTGHETRLVAAVVDDVTALKQTEARLEELLVQEQAARFELERARWQLTLRNRQLAAKAATDPLTKLANRVALEERLAAALAQSQRDRTAVGVIYLDLNGFKIVNDRHGHAAGDRLLEIVAERLLGQCRSNDLVARVGGDEFVALLTDLEPIRARETLERAATRIRTALGAPVELDRTTVQVSCSAGTSVFPDDASTIDELLAAADGAMYRAKHAA